MELLKSCPLCLQEFVPPPRVKLCPKCVSIGQHAQAMTKSLRYREKRGKEVSIDYSWVRERLRGVTRCELTGWRLALGPRNLGGHGLNPYAPSLDRIDNAQGYTPENIRIVCMFVNVMMSSYSDEDMGPIIQALRDAAYETPPPLIDSFRSRTSFASPQK